MHISHLDLAACAPVNDLWSRLVEALGLERSFRAAKQALDLQAMRGGAATLPLLIVETCGVGLLERRRLHLATGLPVAEGDGIVLLYSAQHQQLQLLQLER